MARGMRACLTQTDRLVWSAMIPNRPFRQPPENARGKLLEAGLKLVRLRGFAGTSVDDLCREAGVTKGAFFHHFASKEALGVALADYWSTSTSGFFAEAPYHHLTNPAERVLAYLDLRAALMGGPVEGFTCVAGTMVQEQFATSDAIRAACDESISGNASALEADVAAALAQAGRTGVDAAGLALHIQAVIQGGFILAKAKGNAEIARESVAHLKRYFAMLFNINEREEPPCPA